MDLNRAATFVRVVESGGFTAAASALNLPPSSVSRSVARLEEELGVVLLERTTRKVSLTDAGRAYYDRVRGALSTLDEANALAVDAAREPQGLVRLAVPHEFAPALSHVLAMFLQAQPRIRVEVTFTAHAATLVGESVDLGVAVGTLPDSSLVARRLGANDLCLFAAPSYLEARGTPRALADLVEHDTLMVRGLEARATWELVGPNGAEVVEVRPRIAGDHLGFIMDAAVAGLGVALLPVVATYRAAGEGQLVRVLPEYKLESGLSLLTHPSRHLPRRVALLRDFLTEVVPEGCTMHKREGGLAICAEAAARAAASPATAPRAPSDRAIEGPRAKGRHLGAARVGEADLRSR
jgi:DNA-binding transcriptional LysR family regulator